MKRYLVIVIILFSCGTGEPTSGWTYNIYKNSSDHFVYLETYRDNENVFDFELYPNEEFLIEIEAVDGTDNRPRITNRFLRSDSVLVFFNDTLVIQYDIGRLEGNPMRIENYKLLEGEADPYIYFFEFTNEDYERALERGRIINP